MAGSIAFKNVELSTAGWIQCEVKREDVQEFWVELPYGYLPKSDLVAAFFVSLCGTRFDSIELDLPLDESFRHELSVLSNTEVLARPGSKVRRRPGSTSALNFSGGFDSLAARLFVPDAALISLDFGGRFSREREFFQRFDPLTFRTNLVDLGLNRYSWEFMGMGSILLRDELQLSTYAFGSILAGSLPRLLRSPHDQNVAGVRAADAIGLVCRNPVVGLTEIATLSLAFRAWPSLMIDTLTSVALPLEDKHARKRQMLKAVGLKHSIPLEIETPPNTKARRTWGSSFATDLSSLFVMQNGFVEEVVESYIDGVPQRIVDAVPDLDLAFMMRVNPHAYAGVEEPVMASWFSRMLQSGIAPYGRADWESADRVVTLLKSADAS